MSKPKRKMPKKGSLITVIHNGKDDLTRIKEIIERYGLNVEFKERVPSVREIKKVLEDAGFENVEVKEIEKHTQTEWGSEGERCGKEREQ